jgi:two-component system NtrC family sensor kinase
MEELTLYRAIAETSRSGIVVYRLEDPNDISSLRLVFANQAASEVTGIDIEPRIGKRIFEAFPNLQQTRIPEVFTEILKSGQGRTVGDIIYQDREAPGAVYEVEASPAGSDLLVVGFRNVTALRDAEKRSGDLASELESRNQQLERESNERERLQQEIIATQAKTLEQNQTLLLQMQKMAALGSLLAGVAHEIKTPLGALKSNHDLLVRSLDLVRREIDSSGAADKLENALATLAGLNETNRTALERIVAIVNSLRTFGRLNQENPEPVDLQEILESTLTLVHHELKYRITVEKDYGTLPPVVCFSNQLSQVFVNLLVNAAQAIEGKGTISIKTRTEGEDAVVEINDTGRGIAEADLPRIWDAGFTTKPTGVGTGLGLAIVAKIVQDHGGSIEVESQVGRGTTFRIRLPLKGCARPSK